MEDMTRRAFYNLYIPGCVEHYLVRVMRDHEDFIPELDLVAELDGQVVGNIMYTKAKLADEQGSVKDILDLRPPVRRPGAPAEGNRKAADGALLPESGGAGL